MCVAGHENSLDLCIANSIFAIPKQHSNSTKHSSDLIWNMPQLCGTPITIKIFKYWKMLKSLRWEFVLRTGLLNMLTCWSVLTYHHLRVAVNRLNSANFSKLFTTWQTVNVLPFSTKGQCIIHGRSVTHHSKIFLVILLNFCIHFIPTPYPYGIHYPPSNQSFTTLYSFKRSLSLLQ